MSIIASPRRLIHQAAKVIFNNDAERCFYDNLKLPEFTPDIGRLERFETQFIFDYSPGLVNEIPRDQMVDKGLAFTYEENYILWKKNLGELSFPVPMTYGSSVPEGSVIRKIKDGHSNKGLLYPPARLAGHLILLKNPGHWMSKSLDILSRNGVMFTRERLKIMIPFHTYITRERAMHTRSGANHTGWEPKIAYVWAWTYLGEPKFWQDQILYSEDVMKKPLVSALFPMHAKNRTVGEYYIFLEDDLKGFPVERIPDNAFIYGKGSSPKERQKRLADLNKDLATPDVKRNRK